jgi:hypothetical protein
MKNRILQDNKQEPQSGIAKTIMEGMLSGIGNPTWQIDTNATQEHITQKWIRQQNAIGWSHIVFGRMANAITETI